MADPFAPQAPTDPATAALYHPQAEGRSPTEEECVAVRIALQERPAFIQTMLAYCADDVPEFKAMMDGS